MTEPDYRLRYFGHWWDAPAYDDAVQVETPVGRKCQWCDERVVEGDSGSLFWSMADELGNVAVQHLECWLRVGLGSIEHLEGRCSCAGIGDEPQGTWREQGRVVMQWALRRKGLTSWP